MKTPEQLREELRDILETHDYSPQKVLWFCLLELIEREKKAAVEEALQKFGINVYHGKFPKLPPEADAHTKQRAKEIGDYVTEYFKK